MKKHKIIILIFSFCLFFEQLNGQKITSLPTKPIPGDTIKIEVKGIDEKDLYLLVYISEKNKKTFVKEYIISDSLKNKSINIPTNLNTLSFLSVLKSKKKIYDNNNGLGYITLFYEKGKVALETKSSLANLYAAYNCESIIGIDRNIVLAQKLFEEDFIIDYEIKKKYFKSYIISISENVQINKGFLEKQLIEFSQQENLNAKDYTIISRGYEKLKNYSTSLEMKNLRNSLFPEDRSVVNLTTFDEYMNIIKEGNFGKFKEKYYSFCERYIRFTTDEGITSINYVKAKILSVKLKKFIDQKEFDLWQQEVSKLDLANESIAYHLGSADLLEANAFLLEAENLSKKSCEIEFSLLSKQRDWREDAIMTDAQVRYYREKDYAHILSNFGEILLKSNNLLKARDVLMKSSIIFGKSEEIEINEIYIKSLLKSDLIDSARNIGREFISKGVSTPFIDNFIYKNVYEDSKFKVEKNNTALKKTNISLINEKLSVFDFKDTLGNKISHDFIKNKIVVLDFWATWCGHCIKGFAGMNNLINSFKGNNDVIFLFINTQDFGHNRNQNAIILLKEMNYDFTILFDEFNDMSPKIGVESLPTKIIIDKNGNIRYKQVGEGHLDGFNKLYSVIDKLLSSP